MARQAKSQLTPPTGPEQLPIASGSPENPTVNENKAPTNSSQSAHALWCDAERSARYHGSRTAFFDGWRRILMFVVFLASSGAAISAANLFDEAQALAVVLGMVAATSAAVEFAFDLSGKARLHSTLRARFTVLAGEIDPSETNPETIRKWHTELYRIFAEEPAVVYYGVNAVAHNAVAQVVGANSGETQVVGFWRGVFMQWRTFRPTDFPQLRNVRAQGEH